MTSRYDSVKCVAFFLRSGITQTDKSDLKTRHEVASVIETELMTAS